MVSQKIVARYVDGRIVKGHTTNFSPSASHFHLAPTDMPDQQVVVEIAQLKAIFFVRDFAGDPDREDSTDFVPAQAYKGRKVKVQFIDGEIMMGYTNNYDTALPGFFIFPADSDSNTLRVFAVASSVAGVSML